MLSALSCTLFVFFGSIVCGAEQSKKVYYSSYLDIPKLLSLNKPLTTKHDERFFITVHQIIELGFKQTLVEFMSMETSLSTYMFDKDVQRLNRVSALAKRVCDILRLLSSTLDTLRSTLDPSSFAEFRSAFGNASGYQSWQFRQIEAQLGLKISERALQSLEHTDRLEVEMFKAKPNFLSMLNHIFEDVQVFGDSSAAVGDVEEPVSLLGGEGLPARRSFSHTAAMSALWAYMKKTDPRFRPFASVIEAFSNIDAAVRGFRAAHVALVRDQIGKQPGTGGSAGVAYLEDQLASQVSFPELERIVGRSSPGSVLPADVDTPSTAKRDLSTDFVSIGIIQQIEAMAMRFPAEVAVVEDDDANGGRSINFGTLSLHVGLLAERLRRAFHATRNSGRVGIYCRKSIELVVVELAALKAGICFVPLGITWPESRVRKIILDADVRVMVSDMMSVHGPLPVMEFGTSVELLLPILNTQGGEPIQTLQLRIQTSLRGSNDTLANAAFPSDEAYMIYTSGTTGDPKGVVLSREAANIAIYSLVKLVPLAPKQRYVTILTTQPVFDFSIAQMFCPLALGGTVVVPRQNAEADGTYIANLFMKYGVSIQALVPAMARAIVDSDIDLGKQLAHIVVAGEEFPLALAKDMFDSFQRRKQLSVMIHNGYGPTENGIGACAFTMGSIQDVLTLASGAIPLTDTKGVFPYRAFDVIDPDSGELISHGKGELVISGKSLAKGYHNNAAQTNKHFRSNPYRNGDRSYWTGDIVEKDELGRIYFRGRKDGQVKLRGFRIELHEVEHAVRADENVVDAVALVNASLLLVYVVAKIEASSPVEVKSVRANVKNDLYMICKQTLAPHAVPSAIIFVEAFPTTVNGKIDKTQLPRPAREDLAAEVPNEVCEAAVPSDDLLGFFLDITSEFVNYPVSRCDSWSDLGIDSVSTNAIIAKAKQKGIQVSFADLSASENLSHLPMSKAEDLEQEPCEANQLLPALPTQRAMLEATMKGGRSRQIVQLVLQLKETPINRQRLKQAVQMVANGHEGLRIRFQQVDGHWRQEVRPASELRPGEEWMDLDGDSPADIDAFLASDKSQGFQVGNVSAPLIRFAVGNTHLVVSVHHALLDGTSADLLLQHTMSLYAGADHFSDSITFSSVTTYLCQASKLQLATPGAIEESPEGYVDKHEVISLWKVQHEARNSKVTVATQLLWWCRLSLSGRAMGVIVSGRDVVLSNDTHNVMGMLIGYTALRGSIQNVKEMQQELTRLRMAPHTSAVGGFDVLVNVKHVASGLGYQLVRVEETLGYPLVLEFFISGNHCRIHLQYLAKEAKYVAKVMRRFIPKWGIEASEGGRCTVCA